MKFITINALILATPICVAQTQTINLSGPGDLLVFKVNNVRVGALSVRQTSQGNYQLIVEGKNIPAIAIGGDRAPSDVQITPEPSQKPRFHVDIGRIPSGTGEGTYGDVRVAGTFTVGREQALCSDPNNATTCFPVDPRGAIIVARDRPTNENMGQFRFVRRNASNGAIEEYRRDGVTASGLPFINFGGNDTPRYILQGGTNWTKIYMQDSLGTRQISGDNDGSLKYVPPDGFPVTVMGQP